MMRTQDLRAFADEHALKMTSVAEILVIGSCMKN